MLLVMALSGLSGYADVYDGWIHRMCITFPGYVRSETLTDFPVLVRLGPHIPGFFYSQFSSPATGADLRFANSNQTVRIPHEIESWNSNGTSYVWVRVPVLSGPTCSIWAYWGHKGSPAGIDPAATWSNGFLSVWHLNDTNGVQRDSTRTGAHAWRYQGQADVTAPGMTCSDTLASGAPGNVIDNNTGTEAWEATADARWWKVDLGAGNAKAVSMLRYRQGWQTKDFTIEGSSNDTNWTVVCSNQFLPTGIWQTFGFSNPTAYRYYRLNMLNIHASGHDPYELELLEKGATPVTAGAVAGCADFDGVDDELHPGRLGSFPRTNLSVSCWSKHDVAAAADDALLGTAGDVNWQSGFGLYYIGPTVVEFWIRSYNTFSNLVTATVVPTAWNHFYGTYDGTNIALYVNGQQRARKATRSPVTDSGKFFTLGKLFDPNEGRRYDFDGKLDEVRLEGAGRSSNWVWACWLNQASNSAFVACGPVRQSGTLLNVR